MGRGGQATGKTDDTPLRMTESKLWSHLSRSVHEADPTSDFTRHEDRLSVGVPDVSFCFLGGLSGWTELKCQHREPRAGRNWYIDNLTPEQVNWLEKRGESGASSSVLISFGSGRHAPCSVFPWWNCRALLRPRIWRGSGRESGSVWDGRVSDGEGVLRALASAVRYVV